MAKPWGKYEIDYESHPKFLALTPIAFALWWQVKNYCDKYHTDGMMPRAAVKTFRFYSPKAVDLLTRSCGVKPNGQAYAPLWESLDIGGVAYIRMHDYLDHNDCRDVVMERLGDADDREELKRLRDRDRKRKERADRKALIAALRASDVSTDSPLDNARTVHGQTMDESRDKRGPVQTQSVSVPETVVGQLACS